MHYSEQLRDLRSKYDTLYGEYEKKNTIVEQQKKQNKKLILKYQQLESDFNEFMDGNIVSPRSDRSDRSDNNSASYPKASALLRKCKQLTAQLTAKDNHLTYLSQLVLVMYQNAVPVILENYPNLLQNQKQTLRRTLSRTLTNGTKKRRSLRGFDQSLLRMSDDGRLTAEDSEGDDDDDDDDEEEEEEDDDDEVQEEDDDSQSSLSREIDHEPRIEMRLHTRASAHARSTTDDNEEERTHS
jgi:hypothetical protein